MGNIVVRAPNWIGDAVMCVPALMDLREAFQNTRITLWARPVIAELLKGHPSVDDVLVYDHRGIHAGISGKVRLVGHLRQQAFDGAVLFQNAFEAAWWSFVARIPYRVGYATDGRGWLLTHSIPVPRTRQTMHQVEYYRGIPRHLGAGVKERVPFLVVRPDEVQTCADKFPELDLGEDGFLIGINPGSIYGSAKRWLPDRFAATVDGLIQELERGQVFTQPPQCVIVGGPGEETLGRTIAASMKTRPIVLSARTSIRELLIVIQHCRLFLTNDTGPMHIANALRVPLVAIFGPTNHRNTAPYGNNGAIVRHPVLCSPCLLRCCPIDHRCMTGISVDEVCQVALTHLQGASFRHPKLSVQ